MKLSTTLLLLLTLAVGLSIGSATATYAASWRTAYNVAWVYNDSSGVPHYGAFFTGSNGRSQYFNGPSGAPSNYSSYNWYGGSRNILLLEKRWLFATPFYCVDPMGNPQLCQDRWTGSYHHAILD